LRAVVLQGGREIPFGRCTGASSAGRSVEHQKSLAALTDQDVLLKEGTRYWSSIRCSANGGAADVLRRCSSAAAIQSGGNLHTSNFLKP